MGLCVRFVSRTLFTGELAPESAAGRAQVGGNLPGLSFLDRCVAGGDRCSQQQLGWQS